MIMMLAAGASPFSSFVADDDDAGVGGGTHCYCYLNWSSSGHKLMYGDAPYLSSVVLLNCWRMEE